MAKNGHSMHLGYFIERFGLIFCGFEPRTHPSRQDERLVDQTGSRRLLAMVSHRPYRRASNGSPIPLAEKPSCGTAHIRNRESYHRTDTGQVRVLPISAPAATRCAARFAVEMAESPKFPHKPWPPRSCSFEDRTDRPELALTLRPTRPRVREQPWLSRWTFEAQSHGLTTRCLRFKAPGCPGTMQDSLHTCAATLWWAGFAPAGSAMKGFSYVSVHMAFSFRELTWRNPRFGSRRLRQRRHSWQQPARPRGAGAVRFRPSQERYQLLWPSPRVALPTL